ncbi:MAG: hypothetical protein IPL18_01860 [Sphingomonadales bacterium]|nr:hypothetical protein [Sphingomonadales bacterium]
MARKFRPQNHNCSGTIKRFRCFLGKSLATLEQTIPPNREPAVFYLPDYHLCTRPIVARIAEKNMCFLQSFDVRSWIAANQIMYAPMRKSRFDI